MDSPENIEELVVLDRLLKQNKFSLVMSETKEAPQRYACTYIFNGFSPRLELANTLAATVKELAVAAEGIVLDQIDASVTVKFQTEERRLEFLKAFSQAAVRTVPPEPVKFSRMPGASFVLGVNPFTGH